MVPIYGGMYVKSPTAIQHRLNPPDATLDSAGDAKPQNQRLEGGQAYSTLTAMPTSKCGLILHMSHHKTDQTYPTHEAEQHILLNGS